MKSRPILFSAPMVRAILEGRKTQTRRAAKLNVSGRVALSGKNWHCADQDASLACPYGQPGDQLWVREAFIQGWPCVDGVPDQFDSDDNEKPIHTWYRATDRNFLWHDDDGGTLENVPWKPSIHMPRWASRITLEIVNVRVERLQDIGYADALAEGVSDFRTLIEPECQQGETADECARRLCWPQRSYRQLWEQINGAGSWEANPWVWVVEFKRIEN